MPSRRRIPPSQRTNLLGAGFAILPEASGGGRGGEGSGPSDMMPVKLGACRALRKRRGARVDGRVSPDGLRAFAFRQG